MSIIRDKCTVDGKKCANKFEEGRECKVDLFRTVLTLVCLLLKLQYIIQDIFTVCCPLGMIVLSKVCIIVCNTVCKIV